MPNLRGTLPGPEDADKLAELRCHAYSLCLQFCWSEGKEDVNIRDKSITSWSHARDSIRTFVRSATSSLRVMQDTRVSVGGLIESLDAKQRLAEGRAILGDVWDDEDMFVGVKLIMTNMCPPPYSDHVHMNEIFRTFEAYITVQETVNTLDVLASIWGKVNCILPEKVIKSGARTTHVD